MKYRPALDFARPQPALEWRRSVCMAALALMSGLVVGFVAWNYQVLVQQREELENRAVARPAGPAAQTGPLPLRLTAGEGAALAAMQASLAVPWEALFWQAVAH